VASAAQSAGTISSIFFGRSVVDTLNVLVPYSLSVGMFPYLCELADRGDRDALGQVLDRSSRLMVFLFLPAAALLVVAAAPMTGFLFAFKNLKPEAAGLIGIVTACSAPTMPFYCLERVMMKGYFSTRRTVAPTVIGITTSTLSMVACYFFVIVRGFTGADALVVISLAAVAQRGLKVMLLVLFLRPRLPIFALRPTAVFVLKVLVLTVAVAGAAWGAHRGLTTVLPDWKTLGLIKGKVMLAADLAAICTAGGLAFLAAARLLRMEEFALAVGWMRPRAAALLTRFRRRG
jgi:peptidoglycan biosynthesis protein MviN/MurJ (putative lipid II flippase)